MFELPIFPWVKISRSKYSELNSKDEYGLDYSKWLKSEFNCTYAKVNNVWILKFKTIEDVVYFKLKVS